MGPQIRGGEAAALVRLATRPVACLPEQFDLLIGIDWLNAHRFGAEIAVGPHSLVISDPSAGEPPPVVAAASARVVEIPIKEMAKGIPGGRPNMIALGIAGRLLRLDADGLSALLETRLADKGRAAIEASRAGISAGYAAAADLDLGLRLVAPALSATRRWLVSGNEATGWARCAAAFASPPPTRSRRPPRCSNGWRRTSPRWAARCCRPRTSWRQST